MQKDSLPLTVITRFWQKVKKKKGCWEWKAAKRKGYGVLGLTSHKIIGAHRVSYLIHYGEIPKGLCVCHKCDNPECCNPKHLFLGTQKDNILDRENKGRGNQPVGERVAASKLTEKQVIYIRTKEWEISNRKIAKLYRVSHTTINGIRSKKHWRHV